jgi:hypothetical protein
MITGSRLDKIVSVLFHPLFIPLYGLIIILSDQSPFGHLPYHVKRLLYIIVIINNIVLPLSLLPLLMHLNYISNWTLPEKEERSVPLLITSILYATSSYLIMRFPIPGFLKIFLITVFFISLVVTIINLKWKISLHSVGMGSLIALIIILSFRMYSPLFWHLVLGFVFSGLVLSARLNLGLHTPRQVWYGFSTGYCIVTILLVFLQKFI